MEDSILFIGLLVLTSLDQLLLFKKDFLLFYKTIYPNEEVNRTELSPSVSVPWSRILVQPWERKSGKKSFRKFCKNYFLSKGHQQVLSLSFDAFYGLGIIS